MACHRREGRRRQNLFSYDTKHRDGGAHRALRPSLQRLYRRRLHRRMGRCRLRHGPRGALRLRREHGARGGRLNRDGRVGAVVQREDGRQEPFPQVRLRRGLQRGQRRTCNHGRVDLGDGNEPQPDNRGRTHTRLRASRGVFKLEFPQKSCFLPRRLRTPPPCVGCLRAGQTRVAPPSRRLCAGAGRHRQGRAPRGRVVHHDVGHRPALRRFRQLGTLPGQRVQDTHRASLDTSLRRSLPLPLLAQR